MMSKTPRLSLWRTLGVSAVAAVLLAGCGASTAATAKSSNGGVVTFAEQPGGAPNYILPLMSGPYFGHNNFSLFSQIMYRPLYFFGTNGEPTFNEPYSLALPPIFSDHNSVVSVTLKHWLWSNGKPITARDILFWMNLISAVTDPNAPVVGSSSSPGPGWGASVPGGFPENVVSYTQKGTYTVVFKLNASYNPTWYLYNELSQLIPMPQQSWDKLSASGPIGQADASAQSRTTLTGTSPTEYVPLRPGTALSGALGVAQFLNSQSQDVTTYATNPLWRVVDGAFKLSQFTTEGYAKLVPNSAYSGSPKPRISAFEELPFTSDTSEFDALRSGSLTIGYIPLQDVAQEASVEQSGYSRYRQWYTFGINYIPYNFTDTSVGPIFKQLYFRQAFQSLVNQHQYIKDFGDGIGEIGNGPVPEYPVGNPDESPLEESGQVYPYDPTKAVTLLKDNGWTVVPGGRSYCSKPGAAAGECGVGVAANEQATFTMLYASGEVPLTDEVEALQSTMKLKAGITLDLSSESGGQAEATVYDGCTIARPCNDWQLAAFDFYDTWNYNPDNLPTGEEVFGTGAASNPGDYSNATNDANIAATETAANHSAEIKALFKYQDYLTRQLPAVWMQSGPYQLTVYKSALKGVLSKGVGGFKVYPEYYHFSK
jgi:peptide/nickel transport system substrate-binding protein